jgi:hypothetical protein
MSSVAFSGLSCQHPNARKASDEHGDVGRRHHDRLRRVRLWPYCHPNRRRQPVPGNRPPHRRDRQARGGESFTAVDYDRRGCGHSGNTPPWSLDREVEDLAVLIEATGAPAAVYTSSSGAAIALAAVSSGIAVSGSPFTSRATSPVPMAASTSPRSSECWTRASARKPPATT